MVFANNFLLIWYYGHVSWFRVVKVYKLFYSIIY